MKFSVWGLISFLSLLQFSGPALPAAAELPLYLQKHTLKCDAVSGCPLAVAKLVALDRGAGPAAQDEEYQCTAFLVRPDQILTNRHCIPESLQKVGENCIGKIFVQFLESPKQSTWVSCKAVLALSRPTSETVLENSDYAILSLERKMSQAPLPLSHEGAKPGDKLTFWKVDRQVNSVIKKDRCEVTHDTLQAPFSNSPNAPVLALKGCTAEHGHSGSPPLE